MATTKYKIDKSWTGNYGENIDFDGIIEIDDKVMESVVNPEWRESFYNLMTPQEVAEHILYNFIMHDVELTALEGFADLKDEYVFIPIKR